MLGIILTNPQEVKESNSIMPILDSRDHLNNYSLRVPVEWIKQHSMIHGPIQMILYWGSLVFKETT